jgi:hypothetical protein
MKSWHAVPKTGTSNFISTKVNLLTNLLLSIDVSKGAEQSLEGLQFYTIPGFDPDRYASEEY